MPDWKQAARAMAPEIPGAQIDAITPALDSLEKAFRPLTASIAAEDSPAVMFSAFPEAGGPQ